MFNKKVACYQFGDCQLDVANCQLVRSGSPVSLTQKSFEILEFLILNRGRILRKEEFLEALWEGNYVEEANLTQHIYMLRKALKQNREGEIYIETIPKNGYRFVAAVEEIESGAEITADKNIGEINGGLQEPLGGEVDLEPVQVQQAQFFDDHPGHMLLENNSNERKRISVPLAASLLLAFALIGITGFFYFTKNLSASTGTDIGNKSIAVLPFKQIGSEKDAKLGIGIADVLIARLANISEIDVRPTTSILRFSATNNADLFEVGQKLGVDCVIEGTIQRANGSVRITAQLYDVKEKRQIWVEEFDEQFTDIFTLQDRVSERITQKLSSKGSPIDFASLPYKQYTTNADAYRAYSMGLSYWNMHTRDGFLNAIRQFEKAIDKDPKFANAYAYLADTYGHTGHLSGLLPPEKAREKGAEAANKALSLEPENAEALSALALIYANQDRRTEAFDLMRRSIKSNPNDAHSRHRISWMYANKGRIDQAVQEMRIAQRLDPQSAYINLFLAEMLLLARQPDNAIIYLHKSLDIEPTSEMARWRLVEAYEQKGLFSRALQELRSMLQEAGEIPELMLVESRLLAKTGNPSEAREVLKKVLRKVGPESRNRKLVAYVQIALDENSLAAKEMVGTIESINDNIYTIKYDPLLDPIRNNPTFATALKRKEVAQNW